MINTFPGQICWFIWLRPVGVHVLDGSQAHVLHVQVDLTHSGLVLLLADTYLNKNRISNNLSLRNIFSILCTRIYMSIDSLIKQSIKINKFLPFLSFWIISF